MSNVWRVKAQQDRQESWPLSFTKITPKQSWKVVVTLDTEENNNLNLNIVITWHFVFWGDKITANHLKIFSHQSIQHIPNMQTIIISISQRSQLKYRNIKSSLCGLKTGFKSENRMYLKGWNLGTPWAPSVLETQSPLQNLGGPPSTSILHRAVKVYIHTNSISPFQLPVPETELMHNSRGHHSFKYKGNRVLWVVQGCVFGTFLWGRVGRLFSPKWSVPILTPNSQSYKSKAEHTHTLLKNRALHIWNPASLSIYSWKVLSPPQISISSSRNGIITIVPKSCVIVKIKWDHKVSSIVSGTCGLNKYH